jgi:hypothetical protein
VLIQGGGGGDVALRKALNIFMQGNFESQGKFEEKYYKNESRVQKLFQLCVC